MIAKSAPNYARVTDLNRMIDENECEGNDRDSAVNGRFTKRLLRRVRAPQGD